MSARRSPLLAYSNRWTFTARYFIGEAHAKTQPVPLTDQRGDVLSLCTVQLLMTQQGVSRTKPRLVCRLSNSEAQPCPTWLLRFASWKQCGALHARLPTDGVVIEALASQPVPQWCLDESVCAGVNSKHSQHGDSRDLYHNRHPYLSLFG